MINDEWGCGSIMAKSEHTLSNHEKCISHVYLCAPMAFLQMGPMTHHTKTFEQRSLCTEELSYAEAFTQRDLYTELLHREAFTYTGKCLITPGGFTTQKSLHRKTSKQWSLYTQTHLHRKSFAQRSFYTQKFLRTKLLQKEVFAQISLYTKEVFALRSL